MLSIPSGVAYHKVCGTLGKRDLSVHSFRQTSADCFMRNSERTADGLSMFEVYPELLPRQNHRKSLPEITRSNRQVKRENVSVTRVAHVV